jgi:hypothetical protein
MYKLTIKNRAGEKNKKLSDYRIKASSYRTIKYRINENRTVAQICTYSGLYYIGKYVAWDFFIPCM